MRASARVKRTRVRREGFNSILYFPLCSFPLFLLAGKNRAEWKRGREWAPGCWRCLLFLTQPRSFVFPLFFLTVKNCKNCRPCCSRCLVACKWTSLCSPTSRGECAFHLLLWQVWHLFRSSPHAEQQRLSLVLTARYRGVRP